MTIYDTHAGCMDEVLAADARTAQCWHVFEFCDWVWNNQHDAHVEAWDDFLAFEDVFSEFCIDDRWEPPIDPCDDWPVSTPQQQPEPAAVEEHDLCDEELAAVSSPEAIAARIAFGLDKYFGNNN